MRIFNLITSWLLWLLCAFYVLVVLCLRALDTLPRETTDPDKLAGYTQLMWIALVMFTILAAGACWLRHRFWFSRGQPAGIGFWALTVFFYIMVLFVTAAGFAPYFSGDRSAIQWASCVLGAGFLVVGFPRLPKTTTS